MRYFGFEENGIVNFNSWYIILKLCFREDDGVNREIWVVCEGFDGVPLALMCILSPKFGQLGVSTGLLVLEEEGNFCFTSTLVAVAIAKKMTYKKRIEDDCATDY
jgi:hypothetical protein